MKRIFAPLVRARTWSETLHLLLDLPFGIAWFTIVVTGLSLGVGLVFLALIGLFVLAATVFAGRLIGIVERARAAALLGVQVPPPPKPERPEGHWPKSALVLDRPSRLERCRLRGSDAADRHHQLHRGRHDVGSSPWAVRPTRCGAGPFRRPTGTIGSSTAG